LNSDPDTYFPTLLDYVYDFFVGLSPAWLLVDTLGLLALAVWLALKAYPLGRIVHALHTAPPATVRSDAQGTIKVYGHAFPGSDHAPSSLTRTPYVWCVYSKFDSRSIRGAGSSGSYSVAPILVRDATGECVVNPQEATVLHTLIKGKSASHMFGGSTSESERLILPGDAVIAIGELRRKTEKVNPGAPATFQLRKARGGVLLVSGKSERRTLVRFHLLFWPAVVAAALCAFLALNGFSAHVESYPGQSLAEYVDALMTRPGQSYPGAPQQ
jgi:hypothetical protein